jgi:hypothetical protein
VRTIRFKTADLFEFDGAPRVQNPDFATITALVLKQFGFLPQPITDTWLFRNNQWRAIAAQDYLIRK